MKNLILLILFLPNFLYSQLLVRSKLQKNFILTIGAGNASSNIPVYNFDSSTPRAKSKFSFLQPSLSLDADYRFGKCSNQKIWAQVGIKTIFSSAEVSSKFISTFGNFDLVSISIFYDALALKTNHHSEFRSLSKNYETASVIGGLLELNYVGANLYYSYEKSSKFELSELKLTYQFIPEVFYGGVQSKSVYGSGPIVGYFVGKNLKELTISWLSPKSHEKEKFETGNGIYVNAKFYLY